MPVAVLGCSHDKVVHHHVETEEDRLHVFLMLRTHRQCLVECAAALICVACMQHLDGLRESARDMREQERERMRDGWSAYLVVAVDPCLDLVVHDEFGEFFLESGHRGVE